MAFKKAIVSILLLVSIFLSLSADMVPAQASQDLAGKVIFLDPGHGIGSPQGGGSAPGYVEHYRMLNFAFLIMPLLTARGATVYLTRYTDHDVPIAARIGFINKIALQAIRDEYIDDVRLDKIDRLIGIMQDLIDDPLTEGPRLTNTPYDAQRVIHPDMQQVFEYLDNPIIQNNFLLISLHSNAPSEPNSSIRGAEVYYISPSEHHETPNYYTEYPYVTQSRNFADILLDHIHGVYYNRNNIFRRSNGLRAQNYFMIREVGIPSVLTENGYHTNSLDRSLLRNETYMSMLAYAYAEAVSQYFSVQSLFPTIPPAQSNEILID